MAVAFLSYLGDVGRNGAGFGPFSLSLNAPLEVGIGNSVLVAVYVNGPGQSTTEPTVSDGSNTYSLLAETSDANGGKSYFYQSVLASTLTSGATVTVDLDSNGPPAVQIHAWAFGSLVSGAVAVSTASATGQISTFDTGGVTSATPGLLFGLVGVPVFNTALSADAPWVDPEVTSTSSGGGIYPDGVLATSWLSGSSFTDQAFTGILDGEKYWTAIVLAFEESVIPNTGTDTGAGTDSASVVVAVQVTETGSGADSTAITASLSSSDTGSGADTAQLMLADWFQTDQGYGADTLDVHSPPPPPEPPPLNLTAQGISDSRIVVTWQDVVVGEENFLLERHPADDLTFVQVAVLPPNTTVHTDTGLEPDSLYVYRLRAANSGGYSDYSNEASGTTHPLPSLLEKDPTMPTYPNLPRIELSIQDGNLVALPDRPATESVLIIGPAVDGPNDTVVRVNNVSAIESLFGPIVFNTEYTGPAGQQSGYSGNALVKGMREVMLGGGADIYLLRVGGAHASGTITSVGAVTGTIVFTSRYAGDTYNQVVVKIVSGATSGYCEIVQPASKGGTIGIAWAGSSSGSTVADLVRSINSDTRNRSVIAHQGTASSTAVARGLSGQVTLSSGTDGTIYDDLATNKSAYYNKFIEADTGSLAAIADLEVDIIYLAGIYLDDVVVPGDATVSIAQPLADYLGQRTIDYPTLGVVGVRPLNDSTSRARVQAHKIALENTQAGFRDSAETWTNAGYFVNRGFSYIDGALNQPVDAGGYLSIVAADQTFNDRDLDLYTDTSAGVYAGTIARLKPHISTTHKTVNGVFELPYTFTRAQLDDLVGGLGRDENLGVLGNGAYVTIRSIPNRGIMFTRDVTAALRNSDFRELQPLRIANSAHKGIKDIAFPFLGQNNDVPHRQALETQIRSFLDGMADAGALLGKDGVGYRLKVRGGTDAISNLLGILDIDLELVPALTIKVIRVRVRLSLV